MKDWIMELCPELAEWQADLIAEQAQAFVAEEQDRCCRIVFGMAGSDNVAQRTVDAIRGKT